jgi:transposase, IS5 family
MRKVKEMQLKLGEVNLADISFDLRSRDEIPKLLMGLQYIWCTPEVREKVFEILEKIVPGDTRTDTGRPGMELWKILVLGTLRLNCNWDYDKVQEMANQHSTLRQMLGHAFMDQSYQYPIQTIKDNVRLLTPEVLDEINQVVVKAGHNLVKKNCEPGLNGRCDSFVVKTDVHFPTDINVLLDAMRKVMVLTGRVCSAVGVEGWRQSGHNLKKIKKLYRRAQKLKGSTSQDEAKKAKQQQVIKEAYQSYIDLAEEFVARAQASLSELRQKGCPAILQLMHVEGYIKHARRQIDQVRRRVLQGEVIPHNEKVFSIFEEHTEWICKGKAGVPQELGLKVCIVEDQYQFILHHRVMEQETDEQVAVVMAQETKQRFAEFNSCSYDKGFHSPTNRERLEQILDKVVLPRKGKLSVPDKEREHTPEFIQARYQHSAVESAINAVENHGLDRCLDHGLEGFKRYVGLAVVARNIQILGHMLQQRELKRHQKRQQQYRLAA